MQGFSVMDLREEAYWLISFFGLVAVAVILSPLILVGVVSDKLEENVLSESYNND